MGCNCNNGCNGMLATMQTGDTFPIQIVIKDGDTVSQLEAGCRILVGIYDRKKQLLLKASTNDGRITYLNGVYTLTVRHEESLAMKGRVYVEFTIIAADGTEVYHGDKVVSIGFEPRNNNEITQ